MRYPVVDIPIELKFEMMDRFIEADERFINQKGNFTSKALIRLYLSVCGMEGEKEFFKYASSEIERLGLDPANYEYLKSYAKGVEEKSTWSFARASFTELLIRMGAWVGIRVGGRSALRCGSFKRYSQIKKQKTLENREIRKEETRKRNEVKKLEKERDSRLQNVNDTGYASFKNLAIIDCGRKEGYAVDIGRYKRNRELFIRVQTLGPYKGDGKMSRRWTGLHIKLDKLNTLIEELTNIRDNIGVIKKTDF